MTNIFKSHLCFALLLTLLFRRPAVAAAAFDVRDFGAEPDGWADSTAAFSEAWAAACTSMGPATVLVPPGTYLVGKARFAGPCRARGISVRINGTLVGPAQYREDEENNNWLLFEEVNGLSLAGGILDGRGAALWACKNGGKECPTGATTLGIFNSNNVAITGLTSINSQIFHIVINGCRDVRLRNVTVSAPRDSPNTDGIHVQRSSDVAITDSKIGTGDDCVSVGPGTTDLWIENVSCGPGHGISIGSLGKDYDELGVRNVTVQSVSFDNTRNGVRIKTWARPSKGFVSGVVFRHAVMCNVENPIVIDQNYCPHEKDCPGQVSGVEISDVTYQDIQGTSATQVAVKFDCSNECPCKGIKMEKVRLSYQNQQSRAQCVNAAGSVYGSVEPSSCLN